MKQRQFPRTHAESNAAFDLEHERRRAEHATSSAASARSVLRLLRAGPCDHTRADAAEAVAVLAGVGTRKVLRYLDHGLGTEETRTRVDKVLLEEHAEHLRTQLAPARSRAPFVIWKG